MPKLDNDKQEYFCQQYLIDRNATQAAIRAGYSEKTARTQAAQLLAKLSIRSRVHELQKEQAERLCIDADWTVLRFVELAERCMQITPVMEWDRASKEYVPTGEYQFDSRGANRALELLGKHLGMFSDKQDAASSFASAIIDAYERGKE
ncbi:MAG: terminase small subunit [Symbiobacteriaceae bacterium]|nr:terminase small subunit [Symbiobacteriaceae bacterium]